jgi:hypothetical protein
MPNYSSQNARIDKGSARYGAKLAAMTLSCGNLREISEGDFIVTHTLVEIGKQRGGLAGNDGGFAVGSGEGVYGGEGLPVRRDDNFHRAGYRTDANRYAEEPVEVLQLRLDSLVKMVQVGVGKRRRGLG